MAVKNDPGVELSQYLVDNCMLWVWDWDNTIIDIDAYIRHNMEDHTIANLTDEQLLLDIPYLDYFRKVVQFLYLKGRKIGFASFGVYSIIQAYMNRIFGMNQRYFDASNINAFRRNLEDSSLHKKLPPNKNEMIYDIMQFYKISTFQNVCLFDDAPSNIADASAIGIIAVFVDCLFNPDIMPLVDAKMGIDTSNTRPLFYSDGQRRIWKKIPVVDGEAVLCNPDVEYKPVGATKCIYKKLLNNVNLDDDNENSNSNIQTTTTTTTTHSTLPTKNINATYTTQPASDFDYQSIVKAQLPGIEFQRKFHGDMTYQDFIKSQNANQSIAEGFTNCTDCNSPIMQKINMFIFVGLAIGLAIFIGRLYITHQEQEIMIVWSMIFLFIIITAVINSSYLSDLSAFQNFTN